MKVYHNFGFEEFTPDGFLDYVRANELRIGIGKIQEVKILERKPLSNKGNALEGEILCEDRAVFGLNIGGLPIGTGYETYIPFLEEMGCRKAGPLYLPDSLNGKSMAYLMRGEPGHEFVNGYLTPKGLAEAAQSSH
jgi:hypothetical protein